ncbi:hypothetical protein [Limosilactobacillus reuteri]|uniref:hypothetical protein n=1 Tax=Limosilactobacillus reuteri TaxID=1598 RepID=UPI0021CE7C81|nr:hypothetical protein [Limosilactobacillus reuteri]MCU4692471.1 hypothetical protein [Limosilactobacillus reuteri]
MSFHFDFEALKNKNIKFPEDFMEDVYEENRTSDFQIVLPGWNITSNKTYRIKIEDEKKENDYNVSYKKSSIFHLDSFPLTSSEGSIFNYTPLRATTF